MARNNVVVCRLIPKSVGSVTGGKCPVLILKQQDITEGFQTQDSTIAMTCMAGFLWLPWPVYIGVGQALPV